jgi:hypothetical protein
MKICSTVLLAAFFVSSIAGAQDAPKIAVVPLACVPKTCKGAKIEAQVTSPSPLISVRVLFHSSVDNRDYYMEMKRKPNSNEYFAVLPIVDKQSSSVTYSIMGWDSSGHVYTTDAVTTPVTDRCEVPPLREEEKRYSHNLVVGIQKSDQPAVPPGFHCYGIVSQVTATGELKPNEECRKATLKAHGDPCLLPPIAWVAGGAAVAVGGAILEEPKHRTPPRPISVARP